LDAIPLSEPSYIAGIYTNEAPCAAELSRKACEKLHTWFPKPKNDQRPLNKLRANDAVGRTWGKFPWRWISIQQISQDKKGPFQNDSINRLAEKHHVMFGFNHITSHFTHQSHQPEIEEKEKVVILTTFEKKK